MSDKIQYTNSKVQPEDFTSGWKVAIILTGLGVSLPILYLGAEMALGLGWCNALIAFSVSTMILTVLCMVTTLIGNRSRLSTYMILRFPFGKKGAKIINFYMGVSLLGWFSVALELLSDAIQDTFMTLLSVHLPLWMIIIMGSILICITTIYGIRTLEKLANIAVPILIIFLIYVIYISIGQSETGFDDIVAYTPSEGGMSLFEGISALVGSSILMPVLMADFSRYIYNDRQSLLSVLGITIGTPLVWIIAAILAINTGEVDIIQIMKSYDLVLLAFVLIFISTWMTNATNLYSVSLTFSTIVEKWGYTRWTIIASVLGAILALGGFSNYFIEFLNTLAIFSPSIAAIYIIDFFFIRRQKYELDDIQHWGIKGLVTWAVSSLIALITYFEIFNLTGVYFMDSFLVAGVMYLILNWTAVRNTDHIISE